MKMLLAMACLGCAAQVHATPLSQLSVPPVELSGSDGQTYALVPLLKRAKLTVFTFFSADCPCVAAHDATMNALYQELAPKGVQFFFVDSEVGASVERGSREATRRGYRAPILVDVDARLSRALDAVYATCSVVVDAQGRVLFRGGIDSAKRAPRPDSTPYLKNALAALLLGQEPNPAEPKSLGCYLSRP